MAIVAKLMRYIKWKSESSTTLNIFRTGPFGLDIKIIIKTIFKGFVGKNAY
ncbi:Uncharacterised protein [Leclercia adecarboxylata]|uniref:Uncharacterized protein n=1 Tax=Leclercia adecarboxylata TaxID=83655 RepID=A0A4V6JHF5_9ENTR|nr:Uncharacterised protein [Leclercia adecarboxylata]